MKLLQSFIAALFAATAVTATAQDRVITVHLSDGTTRTIPQAEVDSITFGSEAQTLRLTIDELHELWLQYTSMADDPTMTYNVMYLEKEEFDAYASDADVVADDLKYYQELADGYGMTLSDILAAFLISGEDSSEPDGSWTDWITPLTPGQEYVVWYYGLDLDGTMTTPFYKQSFTAPTPQTTTATIAISGATDNGTLSATFTPSDASMRYITAALPGNTYTDDQLLGIMQQAISEPMYEYLSSGEGLDALLAATTRTGTATQTTSATAGTAYVVCAAYVNDNGAICSPVFKLTIDD